MINFIFENFNTILYIAAAYFSTMTTLSLLEAASRAGCRALPLAAVCNIISGITAVSVMQWAEQAAPDILELEGYRTLRVIIFACMIISCLAMAAGMFRNSAGSDSGRI